MILTITPNPTIDRVLFVRGFRLGAVIRAEGEAITPSGKGVDASLVIRELGGTTVALGLSAGRAGAFLADLLDEWGVRHDLVPAYGETRRSVVLVDLAAGQQSTISISTLTAGAEHLSQLLHRLDRYADQAWGVICGGSLPPGLPMDSYARLLRSAHKRGLITLLDSSGEALRQGVTGLPHILKVNYDELADLDASLAGGDPSPDSELTPGGLVALARALSTRLRTWASEAVMVTMGRGGVLTVTLEGSYHALAPKVEVVNTAGAGDAVSAGAMLARSQGADWPAAMTWGVASAAAVVMSEETAICRLGQVAALLPQVRVQRLDVPSH